MAKIDYDKMKEYCNYFLDKFKNDERLSVQIRVDRPEQLILIANIYSKTENKYGYSEFGIKFDEDTISTFGYFYPDYAVDEFDCTWEKYGEKEILEILDEQGELVKNAMKNGYYFTAYVNDNECESFTFLDASKKREFDLKKIYAENKTSADCNWGQLTKIVISDYHDNVVRQFSELGNCKE